MNDMNLQGSKPKSLSRKECYAILLPRWRCKYREIGALIRHDLPDPSEWGNQNETTTKVASFWDICERATSPPDESRDLKDLALSMWDF